MYFLYIYTAMKEFTRIIIMSKQPDQKVDFLKEIDSFNATIDFVDDYITVKNCTDQVTLGNRKINKFKNESIENFQDSIIKGIEDLNGTTFLINKN